MKDRDVIWIKLYRRILEDYEWHNLSSDSKATLIELLLLASENNGQLPSAEKIAFRLRKCVTFVQEQMLLLSHWLQDVDKMLPSCEQDVPLEKSREEKSKGIRFDDFWNELMPKRRNNKQGCLLKWKKHNLDDDADKIISWYKVMKETKEWKDGFNPSPEVIINQRRWEDGVNVKQRWEGGI